jgi:hypothetical protein
LTKPNDQLEELYDWGKPTFGPKLLALIDQLIGEAGFPTLYDPLATSPVLDVLFAQLAVRPPPSGNPSLEVRLRDGVSKGAFEVNSSNFAITFTLGAEIPAGSVLLAAQNKISVEPPEATQVAGDMRLDVAYTGEEPIVLLSIAGSSQVSVESVSASAALTVDKNGSANLQVGADIKGGRVFVDTENADGFLATLLSWAKIENDFDIGLGFSPKNGLHFHGSSALEIQLASHISLGPVELNKLTLSVGIDDDEFPVAITTDIKASLGPIDAVIQGIGFEFLLALVDGNTGNLGPIDVSTAFAPPTGVGLSLDAGVVSGGGFLLFDTDRGEYGGTLQLRILNLVSAKAIGVITTKMPDGSAGYSLIIIITAEFSPPFQLGYGFTLIGVGGLLGLNRSLDTGVVMETLRNGAIDDLMFPSDVIEHAPQIISDLRSAFPPMEDTFLVGPMAKLGWGTPTLISLSFGLIIEIGESNSVTILGILRVALPTEELDLIKIQVNFAGGVDFDKGLLWFDADLYDSHILFLTLEGSLAVRLKWSDPAGFLVSVGGFHPSYNPPAELEVKPMDRIAINILDASLARIRVEVYFAVTSNSFQTGARAEVYFGFDEFYVDGYLGFDALFQFSPFYFTIGISAGLALHVIGVDLLSIRLAFNLSGPSPWRAWGTGSVTILFWDISADFDITWGDATDTVLPNVDVLPILLDDLNDPANWRAIPPPSCANLWVALRPTEADETSMVLHPAGKLSLMQKTVPLELTWERFGNQQPADIERAALTNATSGAEPLTLTPIDDQFARSHYEDLSDAEKLSVPSFESMKCGAVLALGEEARAGTAVPRTIEYEIVVIDKERKPPARFMPLAGLHAVHVRGNAKARAATSATYQRLINPYPLVTDRIVARGESYTLAAKQDNKAHAPNATFASVAKAQDYLKQQLAEQPAFAGALHIIPASEVAA